MADPIVLSELLRMTRSPPTQPYRIVHIREGSKFLGKASVALIDQVGETVEAPAIPFDVVPEFRHLCAR